MLLFGVVRESWAQARRVLRAVVPVSLSTRRVIASRAGRLTDVTPEGIKVGVAVPRVGTGNEERVALVRPRFESDAVNRLDGFRVVEAVALDNPVSVGFSIPTTIWSASTTPEQIFGMKGRTQPATPAYFQSTFQRLLDRDNEPDTNLGFFLTGTRDFTKISGGHDLYFAVTLEIPFTARVQSLVPLCLTPNLPQPPTPQPIPDYLAILVTTHSGVFDLIVNGVSLNSIPLRITGLKETQRVIPRQIGGSPLLVRGDNLVVFSILSQDASQPPAGLTTSVTLSIPDLICPFVPPPPGNLPQPPR